MLAVVVANGPIAAGERLRRLWARADLRVAADGGARNAREQLDLPPQVLIGDLDSLDEATAEWVRAAGTEMIVRPRAKDETDLELALDLALARGAREVTVLGALGGRIDQTLANVMLLARARTRAGVRLADGTGEVWLAERQTTIEGETGETVSLIPLSESVTGIETSGLVFALRHETLERGSTRGISNELSAPRAEVRYATGLLLVAHLRRQVE